MCVFQRLRELGHSRHETKSIRNIAIVGMTEVTQHAKCITVATGRVSKGQPAKLVVS